MSAPMIPTSWGELIDKITILDIKRERIASDTARANVAKELALLSAIAGQTAEKPEIAALAAQLKKINETLWEIEDRIRERKAPEISMRISWRWPGRSTGTTTRAPI